MERAYRLTDSPTERDRADAVVSAPVLRVCAQFPPPGSQSTRGIIGPINRRAVRTRPGYDRRKSPKRALDPARDWRRARGGPRGCRCASGRLRRARDRAPMWRRPGSAPPRRWKKNFGRGELLMAAWAELLTGSATHSCPFTPVKRSDVLSRTFRGSALLRLPPAQTHARFRRWA